MRYKMSEEVGRLYMRKGKNQYGEYLYFFSQSKKLVFYLNAERVKELLEGKRDYVSIVAKKNRSVEEKEEES